MSSKHEFALYVPFLREKVTTINKNLVIDDQQLSMRISSVLRLQPKEQLVLFDEIIHAQCELIEASKKAVTFKVLEKGNNAPLKPKITFALPLLKRDDFETALYSLVELGAQAVQFITTEKVQRSLYGEKEYERCKRIMISAAEQSKNFAIPELFLPISLPEYVAKISPMNIPKIYFDVEGESVLTLAQELYAQKPQELILMVGPEGDLTSDEKELVRSGNFTFCTLTPTVLRSVSAVELGLGIFRSVLR